MHQLKRRRLLAEAANSTFLFISADAIKDIKGVNVLSVTKGNALAVSEFVPDTTPPRISSFSLNMNTGVLAVTFNELVDVSRLSLTGLTVQGSLAFAENNVTTICEADCAAAFSGPDATECQQQCRRTDAYTDCAAACLDAFACVSGCGFRANQREQVRYQLSGGSVAESDSATVLTITLTAADTDGIKLVRGMAQTASNTFLTALGSVITDMNANALTPVVNGAALQASSVVPDTTAPVFLGASLNMDRALLVLNFSEPASAISLMQMRIRLVNHALTPSAVYLLTGGRVAVCDGRLVSLYVTQDDLNAIKIVAGLAKAVSSSFVNLLAGAVNDTNFNALSAINTHQVTSYVADSERPTLLSFALNMTSEVLALTFSEAIGAPNPAVSQLSLSNNASSSFATATYALTAGTRLAQTRPTVVEIQLLDADVSAIKLLTSLATGPGNTFLSTPASAALDMAGNSLLPVDGLQVATFTADLRAPQLESFDLNMHTGILTLSFTEVVLVSVKTEK